MGNVTAWVAEKLTKDERQLKVVDLTPEGFLVIESTDDYTFLVAVLGVKDVVQVSHVQPLFGAENKPELVVNVPSKTLWSGPAIDFVHSVPAAFGTMGDIARAAATKAAGSFRDKNMGFFINAMAQHTNVSAVSYLYDSVFRVDRRSGASLTVAVIDAYNMSAEDVRNARTRVGHFDIVVKSSSYGSITAQAEAAAGSIGAQALTFGDLMQRLSR
ncbi:hypothetical protein KDW40_24600 [Burkholderia cenocepacia]|uniref:hypothetical protein n=1 Tax=Burkholderia cepacia complex TaxID=87882 RepID=UPI000F5A1CA5|nr:MULTISPECIES: hypothetical protein [Burkholderia cepacia complex]MBR8041231.1 hypothetical protein [Burkholderia cenocepacia]MBR8328914.1 hypothetical protein [Burkholderia cenocepacia]MDN7582390.1 hypothetical protein [Burkholderia orbicola]